MSNLSKREKVLVIILFLLVFSFVYYKYAATPLLTRYNNEKALFDSNKMKLVSLKETQNNMDKIDKQCEDLNNQISDLVKVVPDSSKVPQIIIDVKNMTDSSGCKAVRMYFSNADNKNSTSQNNKNTNQQNNGPILTPISIGYEVSGDYGSIMSLIGKLENSTRKMTVEKLSVVKDEKTGALSANMTINTYFLNKNEAFKPVDYPFINSTTGKNNIFD